MVDTSGLQKQMQLASLDNLRGYSQDHYSTITQTQQTEYVPEYQAKGYQVLREPAWNKGMVSWSIASGVVTMLTKNTKAPHSPHKNE